MDTAGKRMPHSKELERAVIGACLIDRRAYMRCVELIPDIDFFFELKNQIIYESFEVLDANDIDIDLVTVMEQLRSAKKLDRIGGPGYLAECSMDVNSSVHIESHIRKLLEAYFKRKIIETAEGLITTAYDSSTDALDLIGEAQAKLMKVAEVMDNKSEKGMNDIVRNCLDDMAKKSKQGAITGVPSAIRSVNHVTAGYQKSDLIILAARPSMGKTAYALHEALHAAKSGLPVAFFSLEMSTMQLGKRLIATETHTDSNDIKSPSRLTDAQWKNLSTGVAKLAAAPFYVDDTPGLTLPQIRAKAARMKVKYGIQMIVIDYLQLMSNPIYKNNREQEISSIARGLKLMAKELDIPIMALSQLSRKVEERADKRPMLSDLRESGAIEQDADMVCFLYRPEYYDKEATDSEGMSLAGYTEKIIGKHRNGELADLLIEHNLKFGKYGDIGEVHSDSVFPVSEFENE